MTVGPTIQAGLIVANYGRHFLVETGSGQRLICHSRGKKSAGVVGDRVQWLPSQDEGTIERIEERKNIFYRQDEVRTKSFASNLNQILILIAAEPEFSSQQLSRALIAAEAQQIKPLIVLNKSDLGEPFARAWEWLRPFRDMNYSVLPLCLRPTRPLAKPEDSCVEPKKIRLHSEISALQALLDGKTTLVLGPSGAGKSTLINHLVPGASAQTQEISVALNSGKHTTTSTRWYWIDKETQTALIDSPGFQEFGLHHIDPVELASLMPDLRPHVGNCKFYNCSHLHEPGCSVISHIKAPSLPFVIHEMRYKFYKDLFTELNDIRHY